MSIEVTTGSGDVAPVIEEVAVLFANGQAREALAALGRAVRDNSLGASALQAWLMLFDLYQHRDMRAEFEALALEFVVKFERSPPAWTAVEAHASPALATGGIGYFALVGALSEASRPELEKLCRAAAKQHALRVDCGKLQSADGPGCSRFREALVSLRAAGKEVILSGETRLIQLLEPACQPGRVETDEAVWMLLLEVCRLLGLKDKFEEVAVNYAVTFEVSPLSWETHPEGGPKRRGAALAGRDADQQALVLSGEVTGASDALAKQLQDWAVANRMLLVDMSGVTRVDFVTAGLMLNVLSKMHQAGTVIQIRGANELILALFRIMGIDQVAKVIHRN